MIGNEDGERAPGPLPNPLSERLGPITRFGAILAGWALLALAFVVGLEVILRRFFATSIQGADELGGYAVAVVAAFGFALTLLERAHIRIDIFVKFLPGLVRRVLDVVSLATMAVFAVFMAWRGVTTLQESIEFQSLSGTPLMTPLSWPQSVWVVGLVFFAVVAVAVFAHALWLFLKDRSRVGLWYGPRSLSDELEEEKKSIRDRGLGAPAGDARSAPAAMDGGR